MKDQQRTCFTINYSIFFLIAAALCSHIFEILFHFEKSVFAASQIPRFPMLWIKLINDQERSQLKDISSWLGIQSSILRESESWAQRSEMVKYEKEIKRTSSDFSKWKHLLSIQFVMRFIGCMKMSENKQIVMIHIWNVKNEIFHAILRLKLLLFVCYCWSFFLRSIDFILSLR